MISADAEELNDLNLWCIYCRFLWFGELQLEISISALFSSTVLKIFKNIIYLHYISVSTVSFSLWHPQAGPVVFFRGSTSAWSARKHAFAHTATWSPPECFVPVTAVERKTPVRYRETQTKLKDILKYTIQNMKWMTALNEMWHF